MHLQANRWVEAMGIRSGGPPPFQPRACAHTTSSLAPVPQTIQRKLTENQARLRLLDLPVLVNKQQRYLEFYEGEDPGIVALKYANYLGLQASAHVVHVLWLYKRGLGETGSLHAITPPPPNSPLSRV
jgi:hypothetical protein